MRGGDKTQKNLTIICVDETVEQQELLVIDSSNVNWYNHFGNQFDIL